MENYKYRFNTSVPPKDLEETFLLALMAVESLHGHSKVRMEARFSLDKKNRTCLIDAATKTGSDLASIFTGYATREYGENAVYIERELPSVSAKAEAAMEVAV